MINSSSKRNLYRVLILSITLGALAAMPLLSSATSASSVSIVNNSSRQIRYVYLSHVNADDWTGNQLTGNGISPGQSATVSNFSCDQQQIKVIAEDADGCFLSTVIACGDNVTWTVSNDTPADCGQ
jgi:hypothetical protein